MVLDCLVLQSDLFGQLVEVAWTLFELMDYLGPTLAAFGASQQKPQQASEVRVVGHYFEDWFHRIYQFKNKRPRKLKTFREKVIDRTVSVNHKKMALIMDIAVLFAGLNIALLSGLIYMYGRILWRRRATYTIGLIMFAVLLLMHDVLTVDSYVTMAPFIHEEVVPFLLGITALEFGGLLVLLRVTV